MPQRGTSVGPSGRTSRCLISDACGLVECHLVLLFFHLPVHMLRFSVSSALGSDAAQVTGVAPTRKGGAKDVKARAAAAVEDATRRRRDIICARQDE